MKRKIISDKRVDEVIFGFADYAVVYFEKDDQKVYDNDDPETKVVFQSDNEGLISDCEDTRWDRW